MTHLIILGTLMGCGEELTRSSGEGEDSSSKIKVVVRAGTYESESCFKNKMASEGFGSDIYTLATISFNSSGVGQNAFQLYTDENCENLVAEGAIDVEINEVKRFSDVIVLKFVQKDPNQEEEQVFYMTAVIDGLDYLFNIDARHEESGPHLEIPSLEDVEEFAANPKTLGTRFAKIVGQ